MIKKLAWCTDIHLNFLHKEQRMRFYHELAKTHPDAVLITGDIAEGDDVVEKLNEMQEALDRPIYFVLGNHDFWHSSAEAMDEKILSAIDKNLWYLGSGLAQPLDDKTVLVGVDGWADGRLGDYENSTVQLWDSQLIDNLAKGAAYTVSGKYDKKGLLSAMQKEADMDAWWLGQQLSECLSLKPERIIIGTHIPPFKEASKYRGKISDDSFLPFYTCKAIGDVLLQYANDNPEIKFEVYCGHTHGAAVFQAAANLVVEAGAAEYREPALQKIIHIGGCNKPESVTN